MFKSFLTRCIINNSHINGIRIGLLISFSFSFFFVGFFFFSLFFISFFFISLFFFSLFFISFLFRFFFSFFFCRFLSLSPSFIFIGFSVTLRNHLTIFISRKLIVTDTFLIITHQETIIVKDITRTVFICLYACYRISFNNTT